MIAKSPFRVFLKATHLVFPACWCQGGFAQIVSAVIYSDCRIAHRDLVNRLKFYARDLAEKKPRELLDKIAHAANVVN